VVTARPVLLTGHPAANRVGAAVPAGVPLLSALPDRGARHQPARPADHARRGPCCGVPRAHPHEAAAVVAVAHWFTALGVPHPLRHAGQRVLPAGLARLPAADRRALPAVRVAHRAVRVSPGSSASSCSSSSASGTTRARPPATAGRRSGSSDRRGGRPTTSSSRSSRHALHPVLRTLEAALIGKIEPETNIALHFPLTGWARASGAACLCRAGEWIYVVATIKILVSFAWMITISLTPTMGVAWHRFLAFVNIWFKRDASGRTGLGALKPMMVGGKPIDHGGRSRTSTRTPSSASARSRTSPGRACSTSRPAPSAVAASRSARRGTPTSRSPQAAHDDPARPRDAKAPYLRPPGGRGNSGGDLPADAPVTPSPKLASTGRMALSGDRLRPSRHPLTAYDPHGPDGVIDEDVLWSCTTCGACVEQCPVDIEHVDHIVDMRRYQTSSSRPSRASSAACSRTSRARATRGAWAPGCGWTGPRTCPSRPVARRGRRVGSDVDWLFWVGCAGAYEDRAKKTTRAVAELLDTAGVTFAVLGDGETCTGDSARRAGNELLFQMLAAQNVETLGSSASPRSS
jgi:ferredoxin